MTQSNLIKIYTNNQYYVPINNLLKNNIDVHWLTVIRDTWKAYKFIVKWGEKYTLDLKLKYQLRLAAHTALVLQKNFTNANMKTFFAGIALVRYWDDFYDKNIYPLDELIQIRSEVLGDGKAQHELAQILQPIYLDGFASFFTSSSTIKQQLAYNFFDELSILLDGFEFESALSPQQITTETENDYLSLANHTIGLPYILRVMSLILVENKDGYQNFEKILPYEIKASEAIRLTNDVVGHEREVNDGKVDYLTIRMCVYGESLEETVNYTLKRIYNNLLFLQNECSVDNEFAHLMRNITYLGVRQYFLANRLYQS